MKKLLENRWLTASGEIFVGGFFIYACVGKIYEPPDFAHAIYNYKMTPCALINLTAIYLPYLEAATGGVLVLSGLFGIGGKRMPLRRGAAALTLAMLVLFMVAIGFNIARDHAIECGCTSVPDPLAPPRTHDAMMADMWFDLAVRDLGLVLLAAQSLFARRSGCGATAPGTSEKA